MRDASPAFQRADGAGGFQRAEAQGFQTQTPVIVGDAGLVLAVDAEVRFVPYAPYHHFEGDVRLVLGVTAETTGPRAPVVGGGGRVRRARRYYVEGDVRLVLAVEAETHFLDIEKIRADDEEVLVLLMSGR